MLRIHLMQQWYSPNKLDMEDVLYELSVMRQFPGNARQ